MPQDPVWIDYEDRFAEAYRRFAEAEFGRECYQAEQSYIDWLYKENPNSEGYRDFSIGVAGDQVIGCIHKMYLPWTIGGERVRVPSLHNLMMAGEYRSGGGFWLLKRSLNRERHAVIPSSLPPLSIVYRQMKCQRVPAQWFRTIVRPISGGMRMMVNRLRHTPNADVRRLGGTRMIAGCEVTTEPNADQLGRLAEALRRSQGLDHVDWNEETVRWRFFHPFGPLHGLARLGSAEQFALISLGPRDGLGAGRLIYISDEASTTEGVTKARRVLTAAGAHVALAMTAHDRVADSLLGAGFRAYPFEQETYFYHRDQRFVQHTLAGSEIMDVGFEAVPRGALRSGGASRRHGSLSDHSRAAANSLS